MGEKDTVDNRVSVWDGRQKFYDQWDFEFNSIRGFLINGEYRRALHFLSTWIIRLGSKTKLDVIMVRNEIISLIEKFEKSLEYEDAVFEDEARNIRIKLDNIFYEYMAKLMQVMDKYNMLVPTEERFASDDPVIVADNYELFAYGEISAERIKDIPKVSSFLDTYEGIDEELRAILIRQRWLNEFKRKDALWIIFGQPGCGKSNIAHHIHMGYTAGNPDVENVAFDKNQFSMTICRTLQLKDVGARFSHYDEANVNKRESMSSWNKDLIDLYESIREYNGFHVWCNPSAEYIDKKFVMERVTALIYVYQGTGRKRRYAFIPRRKLIEMMEKYGSLKTSVMDSHAADYSIIDVRSTYVKDFAKFNVKYYSAYLAKKNARLENKLINFQNKWMEDGVYFNQSKVANRLGVTIGSVRYHVNELLKKGVFKEDEIRTPVGKYRFTEEQIEKIKEHMRLLFGTNQFG